ncbi:uncharacterized protein LOC132196931 [Neocloeon triangulifer]|uniref:uncharacterized protein LOC132196931 n=1 Tax=Neocloeon triangulifer TaxID=2078957 RepID=UPI00286EDBA0|nr:uncharacterized protein LOC132196931 [Neocloeon triangulifer]XP_059475868.1 uncharacterized protein LOC132196931 [Neocloeon triangulifer]
MSGLQSPNFGRGAQNNRQNNPAGSGFKFNTNFAKYSPITSAQSNSESGPWSSTENSYCGDAPQPDSPMSPLFKSSPRSNVDFIPLSASSPGPNPNARFRGRGRGKWTMHSQQRFYQQSNMSFNNNSGGANFGEYSGFGPGMSPYNNRNSFSPRRRFQRRGGPSNVSHNSPMGDVSLFYKHSMVEDPWAPLEHRLALTASRAAANPTHTALQLSDSDDLEKGRGASASDESEAEPASSDTA